jgi:hypothetical protein
MIWSFYGLMDEVVRCGPFEKDILMIGELNADAGTGPPEKSGHKSN